MMGSEQASLDASQFGNYSLLEVDVAFQSLGPHFTRHLLFLQQDPTRRALAEQLKAQWAVLANFGDKIANNAQEHREAEIRKQRKQQEEIQQLEGEERIAMAKLEMEGRLKLQKLQIDSAQAAKRDQLKFVLERQRLQFEQEIQKAKAINELAQKSKENASRTENVGE